MASVRKRGSSYQITVSNGRRDDGSQIIETATYTPEPGMTNRQIEKALEEFKIDFERQVKSGQNIKGHRMTLRDLSTLYLADMKPQEGIDDPSRLAFTTWIAYRYSLEKRILPELGHLKLENIIQKTVNDYSKKLRQDGSRADGKPGGLGESSIKKDCSIISSMLSYSVGEGFLELNPLLYSGKQKRKTAKKENRPDYFTIEQTKWFLWALDNPVEITHKAHYRTNKKGTRYLVPEYTQTWLLSSMWRSYFSVALFVGSRRGENISLTWEDINLTTGTVDIHKSTAYADKQIIHKDTKTHQARLPVVPPVVTKVLRIWKKEQMEMSLQLGTYWKGYRGKKSDKNYIFIQDNGTQVHLPPLIINSRASFKYTTII